MALGGQSPSWQLQACPPAGKDSFAAMAMLTAYASSADPLLEQRLTLPGSLLGQLSSQTQSALPAASSADLVDSLCALADHLPLDFADDLSAQASPEARLGNQLLQAGCVDTVLQAALSGSLSDDDREPVPGQEAACLYDADRLAAAAGPLYMERLHTCQTLSQAIRCFKL